MSVEAVMARVQELQRQLSGQASAPPKQQFSSMLAGAASAPASSGQTPFVPGMSPFAGGGAAGAGTLGPGVPFADQIQSAAARNQIDPALLAGLIRQESNFNPAATSPAGARGLAQLMPGTASGLGVGDPADPSQSIEGGARYLRQQLDAFGGNVVSALAAYNAGPGAVQKFGGVPPYPETRQYVEKVQAYANDYKRGAGVSIL